jgi:hypothetical protein
MKKLVIALTCLLTLPVQTLAQSWQGSATPAADDCSKLARACTGAARELAAARALIAGYENQIAAADARLEVAAKEIETLKAIGALEADRALKLEAVIAAERSAKDALVKLKAEQEKRIAQLEKKLSRSRKFSLIAGVAAGVAILFAAAK